jgi:hypothetical protein
MHTEATAFFPGEQPLHGDFLWLVALSFTDLTAFPRSTTVAVMGGQATEGSPHAALYKYYY